ncbi:MAG: HAD family hydrolase [Candidatus Woesearchaeota archaeon]
MKKAVLFDFWGTLVQQGAYSPLKQTYRLMRPQMVFGEFVEKFERAVMTKLYDDQALMFRDAFEAFGLRAPDWVIEKLIGIWNKNKLLAKLYPDTMQALEMLKSRGIKTAIVSNTPKLSVEGLLEKFGFDKFFDAVCFSYETGLLKTDAEMFDIVLEKLGVGKEDAVMVGDSLETDIVGAEKAGIMAVLIDRKGTRDYKNKIKSLVEIENFLG